MAAPKFHEKSSVMLSPELKSSLDLIQDATLVHNHEEDILSYSQLNIASPHMPPHHYLVDSDDDEIDESDENDYNIMNDFVNDEYDSDDDDDDDDKSKFNRPPSRLGRPLSHSYKSRNPKRNGPSVDRIKMENAFLKNQNNKLAQELDQCRLTIQALKNIVGQKDIALQSARSESQQAILQIRVLEALILSKHSKDGSIIVRSGGNNLNLPSVTSLIQEKETLKRKDIPRKPVPQEFDPHATAPQTPQKTPQQTTQPSLIQSPILHTSTDFSESSSDELDLLPPPLPPKRINRHTRRWSIEFGPNHHFGNDIEESSLNITSSNITHMITSSDDNTIISSSAPSSSTLAPNNHDLQRNLPRILRRRTGDIIQSLASCRPSSSKNGYNPTPPSTPSSERDSDDSNESTINEKSTKRKKSRLRKIFLR